MSFETEEETKKRSMERQFFIRASAILRRAHRAGIPDRFRGINKDTFAGLLDKGFHGNKEGILKITSFIFDTADEFCKTPVILIDGGTVEARKSAGFALLFRIIACNKFGLYTECTDMMNRLQERNFASEEVVSEFIESLKEQDAIFISELDISCFNDRSEIGRNRIDSILSERTNNNRPTIISWTRGMGLASRAGSGGQPKENTWGTYLSRFVKMDQLSNDPMENPKNGYMRIKVGKV